MPKRENVAARTVASGSGCRPLVPVFAADRSRSRCPYIAPGMCAAAYSRSPHSTSSSLKRQSITTQAGSSRCLLRAAVEISVVNGIRVRYHCHRRCPPPTILFEVTSNSQRLQMLFVTLVLGFLAAGPAAAREAAPTVAPEATYLTAAPTAETWQRTNPVGDFVQREPHEGAEPSQKTEFRVAYDSSTLYIRVRAFDNEPDKIKTYLTRRDSDSPSDWIRVLV